MNDIKALLKEAREAIKNKDFKTVMRLSKLILKEDKNNYMALVFLGISLQEVGSIDQAPLAFKKAIQIDNKNVLAWNGLVHYYEKYEPENTSDLAKAYESLIKLEESEEKICDIAKKLSTAFDSVENDILVALYEKIKSCKISDTSRYTLKVLLLELMSKNRNLPQHVVVIQMEILKSLIDSSNETMQSIEYFSQYLNLLLKQKQFELLLENINEMYNRYPTNVITCQWICKIFSELYVENELFCEKLLDKVDDAARNMMGNEQTLAIALFAKAVLEVKNNNYVEAKDLLEKGLKNRPGLLYCWVFLTKVNIKLFLYTDALESARKADNLLKSINNSNVILRNKLDPLLIESLSRSSKREDWLQAKDIFDGLSVNVRQLCLPHIIRTLTNLEDYSKANAMLNELEISDKAKCVIAPLKLHLLRKRNSYEEAMEYIKSQNIDTVEWWLQVGKTLFTFQEYGKCLVPFLKAAKLDPNNYLCFLHLGRAYEKNNDIDKAKRCYEKAFKINSKCLTTYFELSKIYIKLQNYDANIALLQNLTMSTINSENFWAWMQLGLNYLEQGEYVKAIDNLRLVLRIEPKNWHCWESLADAYLARGAYTSALKCYQKALEMSDGALYPALQMATIKKILGEYSDAKIGFEMILKENGNSVAALKGLAETCLHLAKQCCKVQRLGSARDYAEYSVKNLTCAIQQRSDFSCLWKLLGDSCCLVAGLSDKFSCMLVSKSMVEGKDVTGNSILEREDLYNYAAKCFCKALSLIEDNVLIWHDLASCYLSHALITEDVEKSKLLFDRALSAAHHCVKLNPSNWPHWNLLGNVAFFKPEPDYALAQHAFIKAVTVENNSAISWSNLGTLYLIRGDIELSNKAFAQAQRSDPNYVNSWIGQALLAELLDHEEAMDLFRHSTQLGAHQQGALGYGRWVCRTLLGSPPNAVIYEIHNMHAVPVACDALTWYTEKNCYNGCAWNMLGILKERMGLKYGAKEAFEKAFKLADKSAKDKTRVNYGRLLSKLGYNSEAIKMFQDVEAATFSSGSGLALALFKDKRYEESYSAYEAALHWLTEEKKSQSDLLVALASMVYMFQGPAAAKTLLFQSVQLQPPSPWGMYATLALGLLHNDINLAKLVLNELEKLKNDRECLHHLGYLLSYFYITQDDHRKATRELGKLLHLYPDQASLWLAMCLTLLYGGSPKLAKTAVKCAHFAMKMGQMNLNVTKVLCLMSYSYLIDGDVKSSLITAQKAVHCYPDLPDAWAVLFSSLNSHKSGAECVVFLKSKLCNHMANMSDKSALKDWFLKQAV